MVNKKGVEIVHFVCLSCHFDMGLFHVPGQEVPDDVKHTFVGRPQEEGMKQCSSSFPQYETKV
jgi:hypothetical protein